MDIIKSEGSVEYKVDDRKVWFNRRTSQENQFTRGLEMNRTLTKKFVIMIIFALIFTQVSLAKSANTGKKNSNQIRTGTQKITRKLNPSAVSPSTFVPDMPFSEAIDILRNVTVPPMNIVVMWRDLEDNADIYRDTPIGIDGVTNVSLRTHLKLLLMSISSGALEDVGFTVDNGVIIIATKESLPSKMSMRIYDITDLVQPPSTGGFMPGMGMGMGMGIGMGMGMGMPGMGMAGMGMAGMPFGNMASYGIGGLNSLMGYGQGQQSYGYPNSYQTGTSIMYGR